MNHFNFQTLSHLYHSSPTTNTQYLQTNILDNSKTQHIVGICTATKNDNHQQKDYTMMLKRKKRKTISRTLHYKTIRKLSRQIFHSVQTLSTKYQILLKQTPIPTKQNPTKLQKDYPPQQKNPQQQKLIQLILLPLQNTHNPKISQNLTNFYYTLHIIQNIISSYKSSSFSPKQLHNKYKTYSQYSNINNKYNSIYLSSNHRQHHLQFIKYSKFVQQHLKLQLKLITTTCFINIHPYYSLLCKNIFNQPVIYEQTSIQQANRIQLKISESSNSSLNFNMNGDNCSGYMQQNKIVSEQKEEQHESKISYGVIPQQMHNAFLQQENKHQLMSKFQSNCEIQ